MWRIAQRVLLHLLVCPPSPYAIQRSPLCSLRQLRFSTVSSTSHLPLYEARPAWKQKSVSRDCTGLTILDATDANWIFHINSGGRNCFRDKLERISLCPPVAQHDLPCPSPSAQLESRNHFWGSDRPNAQRGQESFEPDQRCQQSPMSVGVTVCWCQAHAPSEQRRWWKRQ